MTGSQSLEEQSWRFYQIIPHPPGRNEDGPRRLITKITEKSTDEMHLVISPSVPEWQIRSLSVLVSDPLGSSLQGVADKPWYPRYIYWWCSCLSLLFINSQCFFPGEALQQAAGNRNLFLPAQSPGTRRAQVWDYSPVCYRFANVMAGTSLAWRNYFKSIIYKDVQLLNLFEALNTGPNKTIFGLSYIICIHTWVASPKICKLCYAIYD